MQVLRHLSPATDVGQLSKFHLLTPLVSNTQYMHVRHYTTGSPFALLALIQALISYTTRPAPLFGADYSALLLVSAEAVPLDYSTPYPISMPAGAKAVQLGCGS